MFENNMKKLKQEYKGQRLMEERKQLDDAKFYREMQKDLKEKQNS